MGNRNLLILGTRGIPGRHGGFETFAEQLALYLVKRGWNVTVYCQADREEPIGTDYWRGVRRIHIPISRKGALGTIIFDWRSVWLSARQKQLVLTLGYNTAAFHLVYRLMGIRNLINMDGIEWRRRKWNMLQKAWLYMNEHSACWLGNHLVADHPEIEAHLCTRVLPSKVTMIPYGANAVVDADANVLMNVGLIPDNYAIVIARPEPENSILQIVRSFSKRSRGIKLVLLGCYDPRVNAYHKEVFEAAGDEVVFLGAIYEPELLNALRAYARLYIHGHTAGGTNPSLVEALGASMAVLAHDNKFNRWVAGQSAQYFGSEDECASKLDALLCNGKELNAMKQGSYRRYMARFTWDRILEEYETLLSSWV